MSTEVAISDETVRSKIFHLRGVKVMLDRDLAVLYNVKSIRLREQVKRNIKKFPPHFMFQLTEEEVNTMVSQNAIPSIQHLGGSQPYAFTENGALQLASVIRSDRAIQMSIKIIEVFVKLREMLISHKDLLIELEKVKEKLGDDRKDIELIFYYLKQLEKATQEERIVKERKQIGFKSE